MITVSYKFKDNNHPLDVLIIGAGGTGSQLLQSLARIHSSLQQLGKAGMNINLMDDDIITRSNMGRQLFSENDIHQFKSDVLISRINRFFNCNWRSLPMKFTNQIKVDSYDLIITCCDNVSTRKILSEKLKRLKGCIYWIDCGNTQNTGQVWFASNRDKVPDLFDEFGDIPEDISTPSCSLAEALSKQDLFINTLVADFAGQMIWNLFSQVVFYTQAIFIKLHPQLGPTVKTKLISNGRE